MGPFKGGISYKIGGTYEVADAETDESKQCAQGINLATLDWCMREWQKGWRILIAEFTAKDIACIPIATDGKFRCYRVTIVGEVDLGKIGLLEGGPDDGSHPLPEMPSADLLFKESGVSKVDAAGL